MELHQGIALAALGGAALYITVKARRWKHLHLGTVVMLPGETTVSDVVARYAMRPMPMGGDPRAIWFKATYVDATVRVTNVRLLVAVREIGRSATDRIVLAVYRAPIPGGFGRVMDDGFPSAVLAELPGAPTIEGTHTRFELVANGSNHSGVERVFLETESPAAIEAFVRGD